MRKILYILILVSLMRAPVERLDVADLVPVQTVGVYMEEDMVVLETDTQSLGRGTSISAALDDLEKNTSGKIYLDTAQYLLVGESANNQLPELREYLSASVKVALWDEKASIKDAARYLRVNKDLPILKTIDKKLEKS